MIKFPTMTRGLLQAGAMGLAGLLVPVLAANAQSGGVNEAVLLAAGESEGSAEPRLVLPIIRIERQNGQRDLQGFYGEQSTDVNLGLEFTPVEGLSLRADAWRIQERPVPVPAVSQPGSLQSSLPQPYLADDAAREFGLEPPLLVNGLDSNGIDLGASYVWETDQAGRFTLETSATYINEFEQGKSLVDSASFLTDEARLPGSADLQGSVTLTWEFGNHSASAVTNYFDSFKDISELNVEEINELVENITTVDLQYGYNVKTGKQDRAVISFSLGIRNIFDKKTTQILNQNSRVVDQNGRVAYGSIKYQF